MLDFSKFRAHILCEDREHYGFIRGFLLASGMQDRKITGDYADGKGSGEQYVREKFPAELEKIRKKRENLFLVVAIDVDSTEWKEAEVSDRKNHLARSLEGSGSQKLSEADSVMFVVPKRNIETWFAWLDADEESRACISETEDYKTKFSNPKARIFGEKMRQIYISGCSSSINSLSIAKDDYEHFCRALGE